jgi:ubiquinone/menaquinone biosynthesis C-methylase UbiE
VTQHKDVVRESFTTQAQSFAANPWVTDQERIRRLVAAARLTGSERVLDIATGPGYIAEAFAGATREVVGVDLTDAMLAIAKQRTEEHGISNVSFRAADAENLPFENGAFDVVVCRLALHHFLKPLEVVREMARVCRARGTIVVEDIYASEHPERAAYQDRWEILRDPSHVRTLALSELLQLFRDAGLETDSVTTDDLTPEVERWLATTKTPADRAVEIRQLLEEDRRYDLSGSRPFQDATGRLCFHARTAILAGRKVS